MLRSLGFLLFVSSLLVGCSEQAPPCDALAERLCAVADEAFCSVLKSKAVEQLADTAKQDECRAVLDDSGKLREVLDGVKAATRFQLKAEEPPEVKKPSKARPEEKKVKSAAKKAAKKAKPAAKAVTPPRPQARPAAPTAPATPK